MPVVSNQFTIDRSSFYQSQFRSASEWVVFQGHINQLQLSLFICTFKKPQGKPKCTGLYMTDLVITVLIKLRSCDLNSQMEN